MNAAPRPCATCGWRGTPAGPFCPSCGAPLAIPVALPASAPSAAAPPSGRRLALLALAGALLLVFVTLFVVGLALSNRAPADPAPTFAPEFPSATALLTVAPQTPSPAGTEPPGKTPTSGGKGRPTATASPTVTETATPTPVPPTPTLAPPTPTVCGGCG